MSKRVALSAFCMALAGSVFAVQAAASEVSYRKDIRPLWESRCSSCHGKNSPLMPQFEEDSERYEARNLGPRMASYSELIYFVGWPETGALMRRLDDGSTAGTPGNMYQNLGDTETERQANLQLFKRWVGGDDAWFLNRWNARGEVPGVTKDQLDRLKLAY